MKARWIALIAHDNLLKYRLYSGRVGRDTPFGSNDIETDRSTLRYVQSVPLATKGRNFGILLPPTMKSSAVKRSLVINGRQTSVSLEEAFWRDLKEIADRQGETLSNIVTMIDRTRQQKNLSSAIRLFVFEQIKNRKSGSTRV